MELENLDDEHIYFYRVQTIDDDGLVSAWSEMKAFIINVKLDPPSDFCDSVSYTVYISQDSEFGVFEKIETGSDTMITVTNLDNGIHYWKVVAYDTDSLLTWGSNTDNDPWEIRIITSGLSENNALPSDYHLYANYPNPFNPTTTLKYGLPKESKVVLSVFDVNGRLMETLVNEEQQPGYYSVQWNALKYSSGVYIYRIQVEDPARAGCCSIFLTC